VKRVANPWTPTKTEEVIVRSETITEKLISTFERKLGTSWICSIRTQPMSLPVQQSDMSLVYADSTTLLYGPDIEDIDESI
jgi:hypothetical protein